MNNSKKNENTQQYRAAFYGRYSPGPDQSENSIIGQRRECYAKAKFQNAIILKEYIDRHLTGTNDKRPAFLEMMKDVKKGLFDIIYVYTLDRFSRNKYDMAKHKNELKKHNTRLISAKEYIPNGPEGIILESVLEGMAEYYSKELSRKVSRGMYDSAMKFNHIGGTVPFGFKIVNKKYVPNPEFIPIIIEIFERYIAGEPAVNICKDLNTRGIKTSKGNEFNKHSITKILNNKKYIGTYSYKHKTLDDITQKEKIEIIEFKNAIEPIITEEMFIKAGERMNKNKRTYQHKPNPKELPIEFFLTGKLYCGLCNDSYVGDSCRNKTGNKYYYYSCVSKRSKNKKCKSKSWPKDKLEQFVVSVTKENILTPDIITFISQKVEELQNNTQDNIKLKQLQKSLKDIENKIQNIITAIENGIYTTTTKERLEYLEQAKQNIKDDLLIEKFKMDAPKTEIDKIIFYLETFKKGKLSDDKFLKQIINTFIECIIIYDDSIVISYRYCNNSTFEYKIRNTSEVFECVPYGGG